ncbi:PepSY-associated TM helix domain-containing protein [Roseisolibacter agri]|uniref:PepSY-associated TM helix n=1 Tax=Roseisolibacter agri TaxID=2014610 RepID=A0AA37Q8F0_9BACT|nr:PepSY-associated TM helix domain-containing protein [Roseisolibacter agri]GLC28179.1 hypothetical protein rosag_46920 [Roseisolibacter agri]
MRWLHRALGLTAGLVLVVTGLSGSALVFREEIDRALNPHLLRVEPTAARAPLQAILDAAARAYPTEPATRVRMPRGPDGTYEVWLGAAPERYVYADPYRDGAILGARRPTEFLTGWLFLVHAHLLSGEAGHTVAGVAALLLVVLSASGLVVWWPRGGRGAGSRWRAALTVARGAGGGRVTYDLHRAVGFYASALLLLAGVTGASLVFHEAFQRAAYWVTGTVAPPAVPSRVSAPTAAVASLPVDSLLARAVRAQPGGVISYLYLPTAPGQTFRVRQRLPGEQHPNGKSFVHVDPTAGRVVAAEDGARAAGGARLYSVLYPLHVGVLGGWPTRVLTVAAGLSLPLLAVTGFLVWRRRARRRHAGSGEVPAAVGRWSTIRRV